MREERVYYDIQYGCVTETVSKNWEKKLEGGRRIKYKIPRKSTPYRGLWLIIDEFNRSDIDKAFGQLFTSLRTRSLKIPTSETGKSYKNLKIPQDYRIIGTLNTADKHFLFQLSDTIKSRFAYIEIDIPKSSEYKKEIYYAVKNATSELPIKNYDDVLAIDNDTKSIIEEISKPDFYNRILQAYHFVDSIRIFKKLGTGILQLIY
jgi:5-methylcytosine-specific restriction endonuclease McrBC GTP-binding regulatory subunit McrB